MPTVKEILNGLVAGTVTIEEAERDFATRAWPERSKAPLVDGWPDVTADPEPTPPDSFAEVELAFFAREIDLDTYARLAQAAANKRGWSEPGIGRRPHAADSGGPTPRQSRHKHQSAEDGDETEQLATACGYPLHDFADVFGAGWRTAHPLPRELDLLEPPHRWYVVGEPAQLMLAVDDDDILLARPKGRWHSVAEFFLEPADVQRLTKAASIDTIRRTVHDLLRRRRSTFRYCRYCLRLTPPEFRSDAESCMGCATRWHGVVY